MVVAWLLGTLDSAGIAVFFGAIFPGAFSGEVEAGLPQKMRPLKRA
jgi:hypothetical protein